MAAITLQPFNTLSLAATTPTQLVASTVGNYTLQLLNLGTGQLEISANPAMPAAASFTLPINTMFQVSIWGPTGVWVQATQAGTVSVALVPWQS